MITEIRDIGNSKGVIIPKSLLDSIGSPTSVNLLLLDDAILLQSTNKIVRRKPRNEDETEGFYRIMKAELNADIARGKIKFISAREIRMDI